MSPSPSLQVRSIPLAPAVCALAAVLFCLVPVRAARAQGGDDARLEMITAHVAWPGIHVSAIARGEPEALLAVPPPRIPYPLTNAFDGDLATAWAHRLDKPSAATPGVTPRLYITFDKAVTFDSVRLVNGYGKNAETWTRNSRATEVRLLWDDQPSGAKTTRLSDKRGWHSVSVPRRAYDYITLFITDTKAGSAHNDLCLSEIAFYDRGRKLDFTPPQAVVFSKSKGDSILPSYLMNRAGEILACAAEPGGGAEWSATGRYIAGWDDKNVWIASARTGRIVRRVNPYVAKTGLTPANTDLSLKWKNDRTLVITMDNNMGSQPKQRVQTVTL